MCSSDLGRSIRGVRRLTRDQQRNTSGHPRRGGYAALHPHKEVVLAGSTVLRAANPSCAGCSVLARVWLLPCSGRRPMTVRLSLGAHRVASIVAALAILASCSPSPPHGIRRIPAAEPTEAPSATLWVFSDAHVHNTSGAATRLTSAQADQISSVAIRPPSLDVWADVAVSELARRVRAEPTGLPAMFLGDAADISCIDEYAHFLGDRKSVV